MTDFAVIMKNNKQTTIKDKGILNGSLLLDLLFYPGLPMGILCA